MFNRMLPGICSLAVASCSSSLTGEDEHYSLRSVEAQIERVQYTQGDMLIVANLTMASPKPLCIGLDYWLFGGDYELVSSYARGPEDRSQATYMVAWGSGRYVFNFSNFRLADEYEIRLSAFDCRLFGKYDDPGAELVAQDRLDEFVPVLLSFQGRDMIQPLENAK